MKKIETKAEMMREFHKTMNVICKNCKHSERCNDAMVWCCWHYAGAAKYNDSYCQDWEGKEE